MEEESGLAGLLGQTGPLANHVDGFSPRPQQQRMAEAVGDALDGNQVLVVEAGTGTGKTFAYLAPALLSGKKVIISTGTRNLQDQLFHKDLPLVRKALSVPVNSALLKGRSNYLCLYRLDLAEADGRLAPEQTDDLAAIGDWAGRTKSGDVSEVTDVTEDSPIWPRVTSTADNCLGSDCPRYGDCLLVKARRRALEADLVVINHHLLCADLAIKEEGFGEVLPGADGFIIDEAHQLPEVASQFFGLSLSSYQLADLARDIRLEQKREAADFSELADRALALDKANGELRFALGMESRRGPWRAVASQAPVAAAIEALQRTFAELLPALQEAAKRGKGLESCKERADLLNLRLRRFIGNEESQPQAEADGSDQAAESAEIPSEGYVRWFEVRARSYVLHATPLEVGAIFRARMQQYQSAWVFTSATLSVDEGFNHFIARMGLEDPQTLRLESPFDYANNALLYHPKNLPNPAAQDYTEALLNAALPVLQASGGRAFLLFTSHRALREAARWLETRLSFPLLVQGSQPKAALLERFQALGNAVLLGTNSFWEGVDVRGEALSLVVIAKLPFAAPNDPVLQARIDDLRRRGENPFMDYQVPQAVIALKQGVGRLIRDECDRGVLMLCDPRLLSKPYGQVFLRSLPPMMRSRSMSRVAEFFARATDGSDLPDASEVDA